MVNYYSYVLNYVSHLKAVKGPTDLLMFSYLLMFIISVCWVVGGVCDGFAVHLRLPLVLHRTSCRFLTLK